jgi:hypothetical protein
MPQVSLPAAWQVPCGSGLPLATLVQVPRVSAHDWQAPVQADEQQNPCAQNVDEHSVPLAQACPLPLRPHELVVELQDAGALQSVADVAGVQEVLQAFAPHRYG